MTGEPTVTISGNLTDDPSLRFLESGVPVCNWTVASTPRKFNKATNEWEDGDTLFMRCSAYRRLAENVAESLQKGCRVIAEGRLRQRSYEKDGQKRTVVELEVDEVGPSLLWATARVDRGERRQPQAPKKADDPWSTTLTSGDAPF